MPFGSEYKVRLKNKSRIRSVADVYIDGEVAAKGIVLDADATVDLERFVKDLNQGPRFKLAKLSHPDVAQPGDSQNGLLEVRFYKEKAKPEVKVVEHHEWKYYCSHTHHGHCWQCCSNMYCRICHPLQYPSGPCTWGGGHITYCSAIGGQVSQASNVENSMTTADVYTAGVSTKGLNAVLRSASFEQSAPEAAATIKGSQSDQKFTAISVEIDESTMVTLSLILKGVTKVYSVCECGRKRKGEKYCRIVGIISFRNK